MFELAPLYTTDSLPKSFDGLWVNQFMLATEMALMFLVVSNSLVVALYFYEHVTFKPLWVRLVAGVGEVLICISVSYHTPFVFE